MMYTLIPLLSIILPILVAVAMVFLIRFWKIRDGLCSPLTDKLHHGRVSYCVASWKDPAAAKLHLIADDKEIK